MKFKFAFKKGGKYLLKIILDDGKEKWASTTEKVFNYAKSNFKENEEVDYEYENKNGQYSVSKILKKGETTEKKTSTKSESTSTPDGKVCACGKKIKNDKYDKCYTCNQKNPAKGSSGRPDYNSGAPYGSLLPSEAERRNKLSTMSSCCEAIKVLTGRVEDVNTLGDLIVNLYDKLYKKIA